MRKLKAKEAGEALDLGQYVLELIKEKLGYVLRLLEDFGRLVALEFDKAFPLETRSDALRWWRRLGLTVVLPLILVLVLVCLFSCCCRYLYAQQPRRRMEVPTRDAVLMDPAALERRRRPRFMNLKRQEGRGVVESPL
ncbi:hypothetical protein MUK42_17376 [Musa troglodytarum]|uniref:Uncharacterized protein n=1 Tax=Musa troglodytarum TaxID=320322 RepID=A0A9E7I0H3_9LILI|nr:hypothetical protein MUK42_17376 [Musa troglodytarum]